MSCMLNISIRLPLLITSIEGKRNFDINISLTAVTWTRLDPFVLFLSSEVIMQSCFLFCCLCSGNLRQGKFYHRFLKVRYDPSAVDLCVHIPHDGYKVSHNNGVVSRYPSRSVVYTAVGSGPAAAECTPWKWVWLAKNCAPLNCRLRAVPSY